MESNTGKAVIWISVGLLFYLLSPPLVIKVCDLTGLQVRDEVFMAVYAPLVLLIEHVEAYAWLIHFEAELLHLN